jgi:hypothetical protein
MKARTAGEGILMVIVEAELSRTWLKIWTSEKVLHPNLSFLCPKE